jgi:hypothetical protein
MIATNALRLYIHIGVELLLICLLGSPDPQYKISLTVSTPSFFALTYHSGNWGE